MKIPKIIHYCWFGGGELPPLAKKCIKSWKKFCPDYELRLWNETNTDFGGNRYAMEAFEAKEWAFLTDWVRLSVVHRYGGIYLDTDVELLKSLDPLLEEEGFFGLDERKYVCTGLGFGAVAQSPVVEILLRDYETAPFLLSDGTRDRTPCPDRNTVALQKAGLDLSAEEPMLFGCRFLPKEYFCPVEYVTGKKTVTEKTYSIHHFAAAWTTKVAKRTLRWKRILGVRLYNKIYGKFFQNCKWLEW